MLKNDPSDWSIFKNTHEAIIDEETFHIVQKLRSGRRRPTPLGEMPILSGMVYCADCGSKLYQVRGKNWPHSKEHMVCATYRKKGKYLCKSHQIRNIVIENKLLKTINDLIYFAQNYEEEFDDYILNQSKENLRRSIKDLESTINAYKRRISKIEYFLPKMYEDKLSGKISDARYLTMQKAYDEELVEINDSVEAAYKEIESLKESELNIEYIKRICGQYEVVETLSPEIVRAFIEKVVIHEAVNNEGRRSQKIDVFFNYIGEIRIPKKYSSSQV